MMPFTGMDSEVGQQSWRKQHEVLCNKDVDVPQFHLISPLRAPSSAGARNECECVAEGGSRLKLPVFMRVYVCVRVCELEWLTEKAGTARTH